ncbi:MAG: enoyl-CoA hydratase-related protein [Thermoplasmata archaeon]
MSARNRPMASLDPVRPPLDALAAPEPTAEAFREILVERSDGIARITLNRPEAYNAYSTTTLRELTRAMGDAAFDDHVGVIVLTGAGTRAFCTGGDVKEYAGRFVPRPHDYWKYMAVFRGAVESILRCGKPVIARLNGIAVGGGNELHLACDLSVAASHIFLGQVGVGVGSVAAGGATQWLPLVVGDRRARAMLLLNERVPAAQALDWGLVNSVAPSVVRNGEWVGTPTTEEIRWAQKEERGYGIDLRKLDDAVDELATRLLGMFPECLRYTKGQTNYWKELAWNQTIGHAQEWLSLHFATPEPYEGMHAFVDKRPARVAELRQRLAKATGADYLHGAPTVSCGGCGETGLPDQFRYCGRCGAPLGMDRGRVGGGR